MHTNRREFMMIAGSLAVVSTTGTATADEALGAPIPVLMGDGMTDDTAALSALFSGRRVQLGAPGRFALTRGLDGRVTLIGGRFRTSRRFRNEIRIGRHRVSQNNLA